MQHLITKVNLTAALLAGVGALCLSLIVRAPGVAAHEEREGRLHIVKDCTTNNPIPGEHCVVVKSNLPEIPAGSTNPDGSIVRQGAIVFYDQGLTIVPPASACPPPVAGLPCPAPPQPALNPDLRPYQDSNVVLDAGNGSWGIGRNPAKNFAVPPNSTRSSNRPDWVPIPASSPAPLS